MVFMLQAVAEWGMKGWLSPFQVIGFPGGWKYITILKFLCQSVEVFVNCLCYCLTTGFAFEHDLIIPRNVHIYMSL